MTDYKIAQVELRRVVTEALVSMVSGVTGMIPPSTPGAIPDFVQAPIDRAVERIATILTAASDAQVEPDITAMDDRAMQEMEGMHPPMRRRSGGSLQHPVVTWSRPAP